LQKIVFSFLFILAVLAVWMASDRNRAPPTNPNESTVRWDAAYPTSSGPPRSPQLIVMVGEEVISISPVQRAPELVLLDQPCPSRRELVVIGWGYHLLI
jgi:hypothetical protein